MAVHYCKETGVVLLQKAFICNKLKEGVSDVFDFEFAYPVFLSFAKLSLFYGNSKRIPRNDRICVLRLGLLGEQGV